MVKDVLYDMRFVFDRDNPFSGNDAIDKIDRLKSYIENNASSFVTFNYLEDSRYLALCEADTTNLYGQNTALGNYNITNNPLLTKVKNFLSKCPNTSKSLKEWCSKISSIAIANETYPDVEKVAASTPQDDDEYYEEDAEPVAYEKLHEFGNNLPIEPGGFISSFQPLPSTKYDITTNKCLTFEDLCKLTENIARSKLNPDTVIDEDVRLKELQLRKDLIRQIEKYRKVSDIAKTNDDDLEDMTTPQLETFLERCRIHSENLKTVDTVKTGLNMTGLLYDSFFPEGIPLPGGRRAKFKSLGKDIIGTLFDSTSPVGLAMSNILEKHNIHISDELLVGIHIAKIIGSNVEISKHEEEKETKESIKNKSFDDVGIDDGDYEEEEYYEDYEETT